MWLFVDKIHDSIDEGWYYDSQIREIILIKVELTWCIKGVLHFEL